MISSTKQKVYGVLSKNWSGFLVENLAKHSQQITG